jgi:hypothetical protein
LVRRRLYNLYELEAHQGDEAWLNDPANYVLSEPEVASPGVRNEWAASIDWTGMLERRIAEAEEGDRERRRLTRLRELGVGRVPRRTYPLDIGEQRGTSRPLAVRLPTWLEEQVRREIKTLKVPASVALRQILEEWWVSRRYPVLEFRGDEFVRLAAIRGGPTVREWLEMDPRPTLAAEDQEQVLDYVALFRSRFEAELGSGNTPSRGSAR